MVANPWHTVGVVAELFTWIGLGAGLVCLVVWIVARGAAGQWQQTDAVRVDQKPRFARWITASGSLHERELTPVEHDQLGDRDSFDVFYNRRNPERMRLEHSMHTSKLFGLLTLIFLGVGFLAMVVGFVVLFM